MSRRPSLTRFGSPPRVSRSPERSEGEARGGAVPRLICGLAVLTVLAATTLARPGPAKPPTKVAQPTWVTLPSWAPQHPSKEFLRAARILREMGTDVPPLPDTPQPQEDLAGKAFSTHYHRTLVPTWELFGTLGDKQVARFLSTKQIRLPVKSFTKKQRDLLDRYFEVWRQEMKGLPERENEWSRDWLVALYKEGAREDLSNVLLTFQVRSRGRVAMILYVTQPGGKLSHPFPAGIADVDEMGKEIGER